MSDLLQVNALATKRNREQTKRVCELKGWRYAKFDGYTKTQMPVDCKDGRCNHDILVGRCHEAEDLPNGSFTLDHVVGMLEAEGVIWGYWSMPHGDGEIDQSIRRFTSFWKGGAYSVTEIWGWLVHGDKLLIETRDPFDLTAAIDALIKVLETKGEKE